MEISKNALIFSFAFHLLLSLFLVSLSSLSQPSWLISLLGVPLPREAPTFVQVDLVGLPDQLTNEKINPLLPEMNQKTKSLSPPLSSPSKTIKSEVPNDLSKSDQMILEAKKAQKRSKIQSAMEELRREEALKSLRNETNISGRAKIKGNKVSQGTSSFGTVGTAKDKYIGILTESIKQQFNIFSWQKKTGLVAEVSLMILGNGRVRWRKIVKPSNDVMFDSAVLQAIDDAQPFPIPEDKSLIAEEVRINFKP